MINLKKLFIRQRDIVEPDDLKFPITVVGAGGIGSWVVLALAKMGCQNITVVDFDKVELKNLPSQFYAHEQVGRYKVEALQELVKQITGTEISIYRGTWKEYYQKYFTSSDVMVLSVSDVIICTVDSMKTRVDMWSQLINDWYQKKHFNCYIDARMGGELLRILLVNPFDTRSSYHYQKKLYPPNKVHHEPCTARAIAYNVLVAGGIVASLVKKYAKKEPTKYDFIFDIAKGETV